MFFYEMIKPLLLKKHLSNRVRKLKEDETMKNRNELTQIVTTVQKDIEQFERLYSYIINKVYYWCYSIVKNEALAKDLAQESMIQLYQKLNTLDNAEAFSSWLYILVRNICYYHLRSNRNKDVTFFDSDEYEEGFINSLEEEKSENLPREAYDLQETKKLIISFIEKLPAKQREIIILFYLEEFKTIEISTMLDYNLSTVKSHLHFGRKNLEKQITEYQEKNNIKLYSTVLLPLLGIILKEYCNDFASNHKLTYQKELYKPTSSSKHLRIKKVTSFHMMPMIGLTIATGLIIVALTSIMSLQSDSTIQHEKREIDDVLEANMKEKSNSYVESIIQSTFPERYETEVIINLKEKISNEKIKILFNNTEVPFEKKGNQLILSAKNNGEYSIVIKGQKYVFDLNMIDDFAPELIEIKNYETYLQLFINDEKSYVNYEKSFIEFQKKQYPITKKGQAIGSFHGEIVVYIYNDLNQYIYYEFHLE